MIDVSRLRGACPRCIGRRVWRISEPTNEWSCIPNGMPFPYERGHVIDHDATSSCDDPAGAIELMRAAQLRTQVI